MTREQLIKAINENEDAWSCSEYNCDMLEEEGNTEACCMKCAEKQLKEYEDKIRADERNNVLSILSKLIESDYNSKECKLLLADLCEMLLEQLKEQN